MLTTTGHAPPFMAIRGVAMDVRERIVGSGRHRGAAYTLAALDRAEPLANPARTRSGGGAGMEGQPKQQSKLERTIAAAVILGFAVAFVPSLIARLVSEQESEAMVWLTSALAALVVVGTIAGVGAATIAGTDHRRRRAGVVVLFATMTAAVALGAFVGDLLFVEDLQAGLGSLLVVSVIAAAIPVTLGTLLGYALGTNRRLA
jgi:hypothetical protein